MIRLFSICMVLLIALSAFADDKPLTDPAQEASARVLMKEIRCLVCQNQSIEDSNADLAVDLRNIIREHIAAGESHAEIKSYLVDRYGDWVLLKPPVRSDTLFLWLSPLLILLVVLVIILFSRKKQTAAPALSAEEKAKLDRLLEGNDE